MRGALVTHQFFPRFYTGVERLSLNLVAQLRRMGHECVVLTEAAHSSGGEGAYELEGVRVRPLEAPQPDLSRPWLHDRRLGPRVRAALREERVELVHVMHPMRLPQALAEASALGLPVVAHVPDFFYLCPRVTLLRLDGSRCPGAGEGAECARACGIGCGRERYAWGREALALADAVVCPCRATIERHAAEGFETARWHRIPWGVDYALHPARLPAPPGDGVVVGYLGTLLRHKGPHVLVEALRLLEGEDVRLLLYGGSFHEGGYEQELRALAGGDARIVFRGAYEHAALPQLLAPLDAVAVPSLWEENLPTAALNAVASGVPLLVSAVPGLTELLDQLGCGFAFEPGDPASLAALLGRLLREPKLLRAARERMSSPPGLEEEAWRLERVYAELLGR